MVEVRPAGGEGTSCGVSNYAAWQILELNHALRRARDAAPGRLPGALQPARAAARPRVLRLHPAAPDPHHRLQPAGRGTAGARPVKPGAALPRAPLRAPTDSIAAATGRMRCSSRQAVPRASRAHAGMDCARSPTRGWRAAPGVDSVLAGPGPCEHLDAALDGVRAAAVARARSRASTSSTAPSSAPTPATRDERCCLSRRRMSMDSPRRSRTTPSTATRGWAACSTTQGLIAAARARGGSDARAAWRTRGCSSSWTRRPAATRTRRSGWAGRGRRCAYRKLEKLEKDARFLAWLRTRCSSASPARASTGDGRPLPRHPLQQGPAPAAATCPGTRTAGKLWGLAPGPELQIWTALDDAPEDGGCLEVVPGSHRRGLATPAGRRGAAGQVAARTPRRTPSVPLPGAGRRGRCSSTTTSGTAPGRAAPASGGAAFSVCYMSAETKCVRKKKAPRQFLRVFLRTHPLWRSLDGGSRLLDA